MQKLMLSLKEQQLSWLQKNLLDQRKKMMLSSLCVVVAMMEAKPNRSNGKFIGKGHCIY